MYEEYIQDDPMDGDYYVRYLLMLEDINSPLLGEKITLICKLLKANPALVEMDGVKIILDLARKCKKKEESVYLEGELDKMLESEQQLQSFQMEEEEDLKVPAEKLGKYLPKKKLKELKKKGIIK